jgi:hypothetical protein
LTVPVCAVLVKALLNKQRLKAIFQGLNKGIVIIVSPD